MRAQRRDIDTHGEYAHRARRGIVLFFFVCFRLVNFVTERISRYLLRIGMSFNIRRNRARWIIICRKLNVLTPENKIRIINEKCAAEGGGWPEGIQARASLSIQSANGREQRA